MIKIVTDEFNKNANWVSYQTQGLHSWTEYKKDQDCRVLTKNLESLSSKMMPHVETLESHLKKTMDAYRPLQKILAPSS